MSDHDRQFYDTFLIVLGALVAIAVVIYYIANGIYSRTQAQYYGEEPLRESTVEDRIRQFGTVAVVGGPEPQQQTASGTVIGTSAEAPTGEDADMGNEATESDTTPDAAASVAASDEGAAGAPAAEQEEMPAEATATSASTGPDADDTAVDASAADEAADEAVGAPAAMAGTSPADEAAPADDATASEPAPAQDAMAGMPAPAQDAMAGMPAPAEDSMAGEPQPAATMASVSAEGEQTYQAVCSVCHGMGIAGAPKVGDVEAWAPRLAQDRATIVDHVINGYQGEAGVMPAKGGRPDLPDEKILAALDYMIAESQ